MNWEIQISYEGWLFTLAMAQLVLVIVLGLYLTWREATMRAITFFNFGRANNLGLCSVVDDDDYGLQIAFWLSGRIFGHYVSVIIPWRRRLWHEQ